MKKINPYLKHIIVISIALAFTWGLSAIIKKVPDAVFIYSIIEKVIKYIFYTWLVLYALKHIKKIRIIYRPVKYIVFTAVTLFILLVIFMGGWYNYCVFPYDQDYLQSISDSTTYRGNDLEEVELDLIHNIEMGKFSSELTKDDIGFLKGKELRKKDYYIDVNPYGSGHNNNLKYSTGKIFYYTYQKNSLVLKGNSKVIFDLKKSKGSSRFLELDAAFPGFNRNDNKPGKLNVYFTGKERKILLQKSIKREKKSDIKPFRYSNIFASVIFYLKYPGRSVLLKNTGWEKIKIDLPLTPGKLEVEFSADNGKNNYIFLGSPRVFTVKKNKRNDHVNVVYLLFDLFSKHHIDIYEYYDIFKGKPYNEIVKELGNQKLVTPAINKYFDKITLFENMQTAGSVTRPSIVAMWSSQSYTKSRQPVFRNIVTDENRDEFNNQGFTTLGNELSGDGYFTKQISCNLQGHGVASVGSDLGFDENYDYTMEATEKTENFRRVMEYIDENQNRKFFLYAHINTPHPPRWIPASYYLSAFKDRRYRHGLAKILGNIRYLNDSLNKILELIKKLELDKNTIVIIAADHCMGRSPYFRGAITENDRNEWRGVSQNVAHFYNKSIYVRKGAQHMLKEVMNIPWIVIPPANRKFLPGKVNSFISTLDVSPTLLDIVSNRKSSKFSGNSFKNLLMEKKDRSKLFNKFIPLVGRFQRGFILDGRYKYWINVQGLYKYRNSGNKKYLMRQEYLYDLKNDPEEIINLAEKTYNNDLLKKIRKIYFEKFTDYPDKNFIQFSPSSKGENHVYDIIIKSKNGRIIYPSTFGKGIEQIKKNANEIHFKIPVTDKRKFISFETDPSDSPLSIKIFKDGVLLPRENIYSSVEKINFFNNPIVLNDKIDFHIARENGKTGLEEKNIPHGSVYFSRIPLNYWMEMNRNAKDIQLSPGIKEVLRGWGYIQ